MKQAFTLVEILLTLALMTITMILVLPFGINEINQESVDATAEDIRSSIFSTEIDGFAGLNDTTHGIYFGTTSYIIFEGDSYATATSQIEFTLPTNISFVAVSLDDTSRELIISKGSIIPSTFGTVSISNGDKTKTITINREGKLFVPNT